MANTLRFGAGIGASSMTESSLWCGAEAASWRAWPTATGPAAISETMLEGSKLELHAFMLGGPAEIDDFALGGHRADARSCTRLRKESGKPQRIGGAGGPGRNRNGRFRGNGGGCEQRADRGAGAEFQKFTTGIIHKQFLLVFCETGLEDRKAAVNHGCARR